MQGIYEKRVYTKRTRVKNRFVLLLCIAAIFLVVSLLAPLIVPNDPFKNDATAIRSKPNQHYIMGTDNYGRCVFSRVLMGARTSIGATLILVSITFIVGTFIGLLCGYYGGVLDSIIMRLIDILLSIPQMVLAIAVAGILGGGMANAMIALGFTSWILYARLAKSQTLSARQEEYVYAARLGGHGGLYIMVRHILPNIAGPLLVNATIQMGTMLIGFAGLSFLGLGVQVPQAEWGSMISESRAYIQLAPWTVMAPGTAVVLTALLFNYLGDTARDLLEVKG
ncbi:ABC transporter permease [Vallitalea pronyensis]|uniref:ABC transporter permease n=1 Tax=Vallitalea pronyensis TaxID=1348613 RepID=A0A8J8SIV0_9FIRM|nr:ABC transporter permease [Vallitalea pronyensis]QUI25315.1 ABC transporter permease [Vallitalea pronyensis]